MIFHRILEWWKARQRGEVRIAPEGARGRVYIKAEPKATISARVYRAATGEWEDHGVISKPKE